MTECQEKLWLEYTNEVETRGIRNLCTKYKDICCDEKLHLTCTNSVKHQIYLKEEMSTYMKPNRKSPAQRQEMKEHAKKLLQQDISLESVSLWAASVSVFPKKMYASSELKYRMVIDYQWANDRFIDDKCPIPKISEFLDKLGRSQYFTTLEVASGNHHLEMDDIRKTAFPGEQRHYQFKRMPFGLKNGPATFEILVDNDLRGIQEGASCLPRHMFHCTEFLKKSLVRFVFWYKLTHLM